ncbi:MAG: HD domain-containing phosphohydrolase, partial [Oceanidesulfovibrio sp.]
MAGAPPITRLLKKSFLRAYLEDALPLFDTGCTLAVVHQAGALALAGAAGSHAGNAILGRFAAGEMDDACVRELVVEGVVFGWLVIETMDVTPPRAFDFVAMSLQEVMKRELVRRGLGAETLDQYREVALLQRAVGKLNGSLDVHHVARALLDVCMTRSFPAQHGLVFFLDEEGGSYRIVHAMSSQALPHADRISRSRLFCEVLANARQDANATEHLEPERMSKGEIVNDLTQDPRWDVDVPGVARLLIVPLVTSRLEHGALVMASGPEAPAFGSSHLKQTTTLAAVTGIAMANAHHFHQVQKILMALIQSIATAIDSRDRLTSGHSQRVARIAHSLALAVNDDREEFNDFAFSEIELQEIFYAGLLHDVGKIGVREEVLTKATRLHPGKLELIGMRLELWGGLRLREWRGLYERLQDINTCYDVSEEDAALLHRLAGESFTIGERTIRLLGDDELDAFLTPWGNLNAEEWAEIKRHPEESYRILENIPFTHHFPHILDIIVQHHERLDGSGYPAGLHGDKVLLQSRILSVADVYDSLRRDRHYKKAFSREMALTILDNEGQQGKLDDRLVRVLARTLETVERTEVPEPRAFALDSPANSM